MSLLKEFRKKAGKRQADAAEEAGLTREYLSALENGKRKLSLSAARALARVYGTTTLALLGIDKDSETPIAQEHHDTSETEIDELKRRFANDIFLKQKEIDSLKQRLKQSEESLTMSQSMCKILQKQVDLLEKALADKENA